MNKHELELYLKDENILDKKIILFKNQKLIHKSSSNAEILGHLEKARNNLVFVKDNIKLKHFDWCVVGCYYACYHAAISLIQIQGYSTKNHLATILLLIKYYYKKGLNHDDLDFLRFYLDYEDFLFYVQSKNNREKASYSSKITFSIQEINDLRLKAILFVNKAENIILSSSKQ